VFIVYAPYGILKKSLLHLILESEFYKDYWGLRNHKYHLLKQDSVDKIIWVSLDVESPFFFFVPKDFSFQNEFEDNLNLIDIFGTGNNNFDQGKSWGSGVKTNRDYLLVDFNKKELTQRIRILEDILLSDKEARKRFGLTDSKYWKTNRERQKLRDVDWRKNIHPYYYRPFDKRWVLYQPNLIEIKRGGASKYVMRHLQSQNIALLGMRQVVWEGDYSHFGITDSIVDARCFVSNRGTIIIFPLYFYPEENSELLFNSISTSPWEPDPDHGNRVPNLEPGFVAEMEAKLGLTFDPHLAGRGHAIEDTFGPEDTLAYIYTVFHSLTYRQRYAESASPTASAMPSSSRSTSPACPSPQMPIFSAPWWTRGAS